MCYTHMLWVMSLLLPNTELLLRCDFYLNLSLQICVSIYLYKDVSFGNFSLLASLSGMATHSDILEESTCHVVDLGWIPGLGRSPEEENSYPLQYSCLENSIHRGAWQATVHGVKKNWTRLNVMTEWYSLSLSPSKNTEVGSRSLPHEIFPTQGSSPGLLHCRWILYYLSYREAPISPKLVPYSIIPQRRNMKFVFTLYLV